MFLLARISNNFGTNILIPTLSWQIYVMTQDPLALGLVGIAILIPVMLSALPSGQAADRIERRLVYLLSQLLLIASALSFCFLTLSGSTKISYFYTAAALFGAAKTFSMPAATAWLPHLIPRALFPNAVVLNSSAFQITNIAGPALVGMTLYIFGEAVTYAMAASCYLISLIFAALVHTRSKGQDNGERGIAHFFGGLSYICRNRLILGATTLDFFALLFGGATAMLPVYAFEVLHVREVGFGLLRSAPAIGAAITGLWLAWHPLKRYVGRWMFGAVAFYGVIVIIFGASHLFILSFVILILLGAAEMIGAFIRQTLVQLSTHDNMRGRVTSVNMMFVSARNELGNVQAGFAAALIGVVPAIMLGGLCTVAITALWLRLFPTLRDADQFSDVIPRPATESIG